MGLIEQALINSSGSSEKKGYFDINSPKKVAEKKWKGKLSDSLVRLLEAYGFNPEDHSRSSAAEAVLNAGASPADLVADLKLLGKDFTAIQNLLHQNGLSHMTGKVLATGLGNGAPESAMNLAHEIVANQKALLKANSFVSNA